MLLKVRERWKMPAYIEQRGDFTEISVRGLVDVETRMQWVDQKLGGKENNSMQRNLIRKRSLNGLQLNIGSEKVFSFDKRKWGKVS